MRFTLILILLTLTLVACKINYTFTGASVSPDVKTVNVDFFPNQAPLFQPILSSTFTEGLKDKLLSQTKLNLIQSGGDLQFEGEITNYSSSPISIQNTEQASKNRLSITVKVKFTNNKDKTQSFEQSFTQFEDYDATEPLSTKEEELIKAIVEKLTEDIFNKALANW